MEDWENNAMPEYLKREPQECLRLSLGTYVGLALVIFIGVSTGNLFSNFVTAKIAEAKIERAAEAAAIEWSESQERLKASLLEDRKRREFKAQQERRKREELQAQQAKKAEAERRRRAAMTDAQRQRDDTCNFWISEYKKDGTEFSKSHRDIACRDAGRPFN